MAFNSTETSDDEESVRGGDRSPWARAKQAASTVTKRDSNGTAAILAGVVMLVWMVRTRKRSRRRAAIQGLAGAALLKQGIGKRRSGGVSTGDSGIDRDVDVGKEESDEAYAHRERSDVMGQAETNPRGTSGEPDVETETDPEEGSIQFTEEQPGGPRSEPHLEEEGPHDPRMEDDEEEVEVDLSEASMADEASEATGPTPEQSQPSSTEGTEPEPTPAEDASHVQADVPDGESDADSDDEAGADSDDEETEDESEDDR